MKLYHTSQTRSIRPRWLLEEAGEPYDLVRIDMANGEQRGSEYRKIHPHGTLPALVDGDLVLIESAAICAHLADKLAGGRFAPPPGSAERALYYQWIVYTVATLEPPLIQIFMHSVRLPEAERSAAILAQGREGFAAVGKVLSDAVADKEFLVADRFTAADVMVGSTLIWAKWLGLLQDFPELDRYVTALGERPACRRALAD